MDYGPFFNYFIGIESDLVKISRKTDSIVDWMGNCGGFMEALKIVSNMIIGSYNGYALKLTLAMNLVRFVPSLSSNSEKNDKVKLNQRRRQFRKKYMTSKKDPKRKNLI